MNGSGLELGSLEPPEDPGGIAVTSTSTTHVFYILYMMG